MPGIRRNVIAHSRLDFPFQDQNVELTVTVRQSEAQAILPQCLKINVLIYRYVLLAKCCVIPTEFGDLLQHSSGDVLFHYQESAEQQRAASPISFLDLAARLGVWESVFSITV